jgi:hypothetical protein
MRSHQSSNKIEPLQHFQVSHTYTTKGTISASDRITAIKSNGHDAQASHSPFFSPLFPVQGRARSFFLIHQRHHSSSLVRNLAPIKNPIIIKGAATPAANFFFRSTLFSATTSKGTQDTLSRSLRKRDSAARKSNAENLHRLENGAARLLPDFN